MTPEHAEAKRRVQKYIRRWRCLVPPGYDLYHSFSEVNEDEDATTAAKTKAQWKYHQGTICWYLPCLCSCTEEYVERTVIHELVHVMLDPMESNVPDKHHELCEWVVEAVARTAIRIRKHAIEDVGRLAP